MHNQHPYAAEYDRQLKAAREKRKEKPVHTMPSAESSARRKGSLRGSTAVAGGGNAECSLPSPPPLIESNPLPATVAIHSAMAATDRSQQHPADPCPSPATDNSSNGSCTNTLLPDSSSTSESTTLNIPETSPRAAETTLAIPTEVIPSTAEPSPTRGFAIAVDSSWPPWLKKQIQLLQEVGGPVVLQDIIRLLPILDLTLGNPGGKASFTCLIHSWLLMAVLPGSIGCFRSDWPPGSTQSMD